MTSPGAAPRRTAADDDRGVRRIVDRVLAHLGMDVVYLTEFRKGRQIFRAVRGDHDAFGVGPGTEHPLPASVCRQMVEGELPNVIADVEADDRVAALDEAYGGRVGAYIGVPVRLSDGSLYGSLCALSREPRPELDDRDVGVIEVLAEFLAEPLDGWRRRQTAFREIERLLLDDAIVPALQPIVSLVDGRCVGVEALARFPENEDGPESIFGRARDSGLDVPLEHAAIRAALAQRDRVPDGAYLSFNVGPAGILADGFSELLGSHAPVEGLVLEVTEHVSVAEYAALADVLQPFRSAGMRLAVDDVGAGYSSLRHVLRMAPDVMKIDRSLVNGISGDVALRTIVTGIVLLALDVGAETIAEGVETAADASALTDLGVDLVQGYLFAAPSIDHDEWRTWETPWLLPGRPPARSRQRHRMTS